MNENTFSFMHRIHQLIAFNGLFNHTMLCMQAKSVSGATGQAGMQSLPFGEAAKATTNIHALIRRNYCQVARS